ncbi:MAG: tRNA pseudouridine(38-40) synthase TruA [Bacteroidia bacterium]|nr:tRNA pseudouridine(38-40) synthase TruA [Bacteroidia bacterium]
MRYILDISYRGTAYGGWQSQPNAPSVQAALEQALATILRSPVSVTGAGRTDAGVHARRQMAHFDWDEPLTGRILARVNGVLPRDIAVHTLYETPDPAFSCRFTATSRTYRYQVSTRKAPLLPDLAAWVRFPLDPDSMNEGAAWLMSYESFESFCKSHSYNDHFRCRIDRAHWYAGEDGLLVFEITANRFLRGMVRAIVGSLIEVGRGVLTPEDFRRMIEAQDRRAAGPNAPPEGLFLWDITYPEGTLRPV